MTTYSCHRASVAAASVGLGISMDCDGQDENTIMSLAAKEPLTS
jgi:hypothetical protein